MRSFFVICLMRFLLTLFCGMGLGFMFFHFPVLGGGIGLIVSTCSLMLSLGFLASCFNGNLISCDLLNFLRYFLFISILYDLVFKPLLGKVVILLLSFIFISIYIL